MSKLSFTYKQILGSYSDSANSTSKYSDLVPGRKCLPGHSLLKTHIKLHFQTVKSYCIFQSVFEHFTVLMHCFGQYVIPTGLQRLLSSSSQNKPALTKLLCYAKVIKNKNIVNK